MDDRIARLPDGYVLDTDPARVDVDVAWQFLSTQAYWARWRSREELDAQLAAAWRVVGIYHVDDGMVAFARAMSDGVASAYLADVFVLPAHRRRGLGEALVAAMVAYGPGSSMRWMLHTADAHGLYAKFGFAPPDDMYLERPSQRAVPEGPQAEPPSAP